MMILGKEILKIVDKLYTLFFTAKSYYYGPKTDSSIIREAITKEYTSTNRNLQVDIVNIV